MQQKHLNRTINRWAKVYGSWLSYNGDVVIYFCKLEASSSMLSSAFHAMASV